MFFFYQAIVSDKETIKKRSSKTSRLKINDKV